MMMTIKKALYAVLMSTALVLTVPAETLALEALSCTTEASGKGCAGDCASCHKMKPEEADILLKTSTINAKVKDVRMSKVKGLWEIEGEMGDQKFLVYMDFAKQYLIQGKGGMMFIPVADIGKPQKQPEMKKLDLSKIPVEKAILIGDKKADKKIIVFSDPDCPYCQKLHPEMKKIVEKRKDVAFLIKLYPLPMHPEAYDKAKAIVCEKSADKAMKLMDDAFSGKSISKPNAKCDASEVDNNLKLAAELGIRGTPAIIFPDGRLLPGYVEADAILAILDAPADAPKDTVKDTDKPKD